MRISLPFAIKKIAQTLGMRRLVTQAKKIRARSYRCRWAGVSGFDGGPTRDRTN